MAPDATEQDANLQPDEELETEREPEEDSPFTPPPLREDDDTGDDTEGVFDIGNAPVVDDVSDHVTPEQLDKANKQSITRFKVYANSVTGYYEGLPVTLVECPLCPDQHKGFVDARQAGNVPQVVQDAVRFYFGIAREQDYELDTDYSECPKCKGKGNVALPTHVPGEDRMECRRCHGKGYLPPAGVVETNGHVETGPTVYGHEMPVTQAFDDVDEWDEPRILPDGRQNPNFGKMPNRKVQVEPWGVTAGLNAMSS